MKLRVSVMLFLLVFLVGFVAAGSVSEDRAALTALYEATGGGSWDDDAGWLSSSDLGDWFGVETNSAGRVVRIDLRDNNLVGELPPAIGALDEVKYFNVKHNYLDGSLPREIGGMRSLEMLLLNGPEGDPSMTRDRHPGKDRTESEQSNRFPGPLPSEIGELSNLLHLELLWAGVTEVPAEIGQLSNLLGLHLSRNNLTSFPAEANNLDNLLTLSLGSNSISEMPDISGMVSMRHLRLGGNGLSGDVPDVRFSDDMRIFSATRNEFDGSFPAWLVDGSLPRLHTISLAWNDITGSFPEDVSPERLTMLTVDGNSMSGEIPAGFSNAYRIINFGLGWNDFEGVFPDMSNSHQLRYIRARSNRFSGPIPMVDTTNEKLTSLFFQNNEFSGCVNPALAEATDLPRFRDFELQNNRFHEEELQPLRDALAAKGESGILRDHSQSPTGSPQLCDGDYEPPEEKEEDEKEEEGFDLSAYPSPRSASVSGSYVHVEDTAIWHEGYYSVDGSSWSAFSLTGESVGEWVVGSAVSKEAVSSSAQYFAVFSCLWQDSGWDCEDDWQVLEHN